MNHRYFILLFIFCFGFFTQEKANATDCTFLIPKESEAVTYYDTDTELVKGEPTLTHCKTDCASVSGKIARPIQDLYTQLLDPKTIRNDSGTTILVTEQKLTANTALPITLKQIEQSITIKPTFFLTIEWKELWTYQLKAGTEKDPKTIFITYEKTSGTSHIHKLCGLIQLSKLSPTETGAYFFEEISADRRNSVDLMKDQKGTLRTLRKAK